MHVYKVLFSSSRVVRRDDPTVSARSQCGYGSGAGVGDSGMLRRVDPLDQKKIKKIRKTS